ncbi:MAG: hypothetical protein ALECFALPRED_007592 [Alectoria fallacina]|uniref:Uncharacterized protein n=1 Tax=Alectoria fallacina TaxID=1903189 RepID=A0A8H3G7H2_9LECA|nr:MAG: hypothetical protein ALECFALPRED_007592 [Alectoria fallacina]
MSSFPLLTLPRELRDPLYEYIVISGSLSALLVLSHQIRQEAIELLHRKATYGGSFAADFIADKSRVLPIRCRELCIFLPANELSTEPSGRDFEAFCRHNHPFLTQDCFSVMVHYGEVARSDTRAVDMDRLREVEYWWSLIQNVVRYGHSWLRGKCTSVTYQGGIYAKVGNYRGPLWDAPNLSSAGH